MSHNTLLSKTKLALDIADPEQRHLLVGAQIRNGLPLQIRAIRELRGWTQAKLAEQLGTTQNTISRLESPKTSKPTITTLKRIAEACDVALIVKFAPFSEFINSVGGMTRKSVGVPSYDEEAKEESKDAKDLLEVEAEIKARPELELGALRRVANMTDSGADTITRWSDAYKSALSYANPEVPEMRMPDVSSPKKDVGATHPPIPQSEPLGAGDKVVAIDIKRRKPTWKKNQITSQAYLPQLKLAKY